MALSGHANLPKSVDMVIHPARETFTPFGAMSSMANLISNLRPGQDWNVLSPWSINSLTWASPLARSTVKGVVMLMIRATGKQTYIIGEPCWVECLDLGDRKGRVGGICLM